jgi:uncharacterized protein
MENTTAKRVWGGWTTFGFGLLVIAALFIVQSMVAIVFVIVKLASIPGLNSLQDFMNEVLAYEGLITSLATLASSVVCVGLILILVKARKSNSIKGYLALGSISGKTILTTIGITIGFIILSDGLSIVLHRPPDPDFMVQVYKTSVWPALMWVSFVVFGPIFEEFLFRGFLFEGFSQSRMGPVGAIAITSLAWSSLHLQYGIYEIATIFVMGLVFGVVRWKTGSLRTTIIMHAFTNFVALLEVALNLNGLIH